MKRLVLSFLCITTRIFAEGDYQFAGKHFIASYLECDLDALRDLQGMGAAMDEAVKASGATVLDKAAYMFFPDAMTAVYLLSESHGSIHTYPEHGACFVDLFTCGNKCSAQKFDEVLRAYLQPKQVNARFFNRASQMEEIDYVLEISH